jgi:hypothetical protein
MSAISVAASPAGYHVVGMKNEDAPDIRVVKEKE